MIDSEWLKGRIDEVRESIGRDITVYTPLNVPCPLCTASGYYDPVADGTYYFTCPVCSGQYYLPTVSGHLVLARIHWTNDEAIQATPGGKYFTGDATATVDTKYLDLFEEAQVDGGKVVVDNHDMQIMKIIPQGAPTINRYRIVLANMGDRPK